MRMDKKMHSRADGQHRGDTVQLGRSSLRVPPVVCSARILRCAARSCRHSCLHRRSPRPRTGRVPSPAPQDASPWLWLAAVLRMYHPLCPAAAHSWLLGQQRPADWTILRLRRRQQAVVDRPSARLIHVCSVARVINTPLFDVSVSGSSLQPVCRRRT